MLQSSVSVFVEAAAFHSFYMVWSFFPISVGDMIALGSQNGCIYLFRVSRDGFSYKKLNKIRGTQPLQHLDWSIDAFYLQSVTVDFDLLFCTRHMIFPISFIHFNESRRVFAMLIATFSLPFTGDVRSLSPERSPIAMKDIKWLTQNCTVGFLVAGQWNNRYYTNAATTITTCNRASGHDMMASGDAEGYIRLFRFVSHYRFTSHAWPRILRTCKHKKVIFSCRFPIPDIHASAIVPNTMKSNHIRAQLAVYDLYMVIVH